MCKHWKKAEKALEKAVEERQYLCFGANLLAKDLMEKIIPYMSLNSCELSRQGGFASEQTGDRFAASGEAGRQSGKRG